MRLLYIASRNPFPVSTGRQKMIEQSLMMLNEIGFEIDLFYPENNEKFNAPEHIRLKTINSYNKPNVLKILRNIVFFPFNSLQENLFFTYNEKNNIEKFIKKNKPDIIWCDMIRTSVFVKNIDMPKILDMDDILSNRYSQYLSSGNTNNIFGANKNNVPSIINFLANTFGSYVLKIEKKKIEKSEKDMSLYFDAISLVSNKEKEEYNDKKLKNIDIFSFPPCYKIDNIKNTILKDGEKQRLVFLGNNTYQPNIEAIEKYIIELKDNLVKNKREIDVVVIGKIDDVLKSKLESKNIIVTGFVDKVENYVFKKDIMVLPLDTGTGVKLKVLDSLSYGLPVVTTSKGIEGTALVPDEHFILCDNYSKDLYNVIKDILDKKYPLKEIGLKGKKFIEDNHSWDNTKNNLSCLIYKIITKNRSLNV